MRLRRKIFQISCAICFPHNLFGHFAAQERKSPSTFIVIEFTIKLRQKYNKTNSPSFCCNTHYISFYVKQQSPNQTRSQKSSMEGADSGVQGAEPPAAGGQLGSKGGAHKIWRFLLIFGEKSSFLGTSFCYLKGC